MKTLIACAALVIVSAAHDAAAQGRGIDVGSGRGGAAE